MKQLQKSDLKIGEIYVSNINGKCLFKYLDLNGSNNPNVRNSFFKGGATIGLGLNNFTEATPEEKHWLKECIKADKFVSYEEAMKTFVPEYVQCVDWKSHLNNPSHIEGVVYKILDGNFVELNPKYSLGIPTNYLIYQGSFKPSTKEAYEAQFVVKETEFVLPETWWVRITQENLEDIYKFLGFEPYEKAVGYIAGMVKHYRTGKIEKSWNFKPTTVYGSTFGDEITTEQFRKYVLKKQDENISKFINDTTVINKEGEVFKVGDVIKFANNTLKAKIIDFRWKNDKSEICAVLPNIPNGVGIDKIELCIEPKVEPKQELSLLEQAKLRYPIGTKFKCVNKNDIHSGREFSIVTDYKQLEGEDSNWGVFCSDNGWIVLHNQWAEIVEDFVLPEKWCIKDVKEVKEFFENYNHGGYTCSNNAYLHYPRIVGSCYFQKIQNGYTEITLEQFKKYVLNEKV